MSELMAANTGDIETNSRIAHWTIDTKNQFEGESDVFKMGNWDWKLHLVNFNGSFLVGLDPVNLRSDEDVPIASFSIRALCSNKMHEAIRDCGRDDCSSEEDADMMFYRDNVLWMLNNGKGFTGKIIVEIEFFDLKTIIPTSGEICSIWSRDLYQKQLHQNGLITSVGRMLSENIHTDVTIITYHGIRFNAHRAILASRSSVFRSMFSLDMPEKELSTITMPSDIPAEACKALIDYIYGNMKSEDLKKNLFELLRAAHKYDIPELLHECDECLTNDIDRKNVLERLQTADLYGLPELKSRCLKYLVKFGKIFEINKDDMDTFLKEGDKQHIVGIFCEILKDWKTFRQY